MLNAQRGVAVVGLSILGASAFPAIAVASPGAGSGECGAETCLVQVVRPPSGTRPVVREDTGSGAGGGDGSGSGEGSGSGGGGGGGDGFVVSRSGGGGGGAAPLPSRTYTRDAGGGQVQTCIDSPVPETGNPTQLGGQAYCSAPFTPADPAAPADPNAPAPAPPPIQISPEQLAQIAVAQLEVPVPEIGMTPEPGPGRMATVGVPVWLWTDPGIWEERSATAALGGLSVTATASLANVTWDMGDGQSVTCTVPGTPYQDSYGLTDSPDCGHTYEQTSAEQSGLEYPITATANYAVVISGAAQGTDELSASSSTALPVGEYQVVVTG